MFTHSKYERHLLTAALFALAASGPLFAAETASAKKIAATNAVRAPDADADHGPDHGPDHGADHEHGEGHRGHPMPPFMHELHQIDLTDAQKQTIRGYFESKRETLHSQMDAVHQARQAFDAALPGSSQFITAQAQLEQVEVAATQARIRNEAELKTKIYSVLTDEQKTKLQTLIAQRPNDRPPPPPPPGE
jgi:Spy/CpxP family protein refolding chaperone